MSNGIFHGVRIVELAQYVFVPGAGVLLGDHGAEVIHVESTGKGDPYRSLRVGDGREVGSTNLAMEQNNRGKKSIALDLKSPQGREAFLALIKTADVFLTSLRPKAIRALGLDVDDLKAVNPRLIYARGNGYGFRGAEADRPGFNPSAFWARGGMAYALTPPGQDETPPRPAFGDHSGSMSLAFGIASALYHRANTGEAQVVETSLLSTAVWMLSADITYSQTPNYQVHSPGGSRFPLMSTYATKDGRQLKLMLLDPQPHWPGLCHILGLEHLTHDAKFHDNPARMQNAKELIGVIGEIIGSRDWTEWEPSFLAWDAPWELIRTIHEVAVDPQVIANDMTLQMTTDEGVQVRLVAGPVAFDSRTATTATKGSPKMGEHTDELLRSAGLSDADIVGLKAAGAAQ